MYCTNCGEKNEENAKFCTGCGAPINTGKPADPIQETYIEREMMNPRPKSSKRRYFIRLGVILASVIVITGVAIILFKPGGGEEADTKLPIPEELFGFGKNKEETADTTSTATLEDSVTVVEDNSVTDWDASSEPTSDGTEAVAEADTNETVTEELPAEETYQYGEAVDLSSEETDLLAALVKAAYATGNYDATVYTDTSQMNFLWDLVYRSDIEVITPEEINGEFGYILGELLSDTLFWGLGQRLDLTRLKDYDRIISPYDHTFQESYIRMDGADGERYPRLIVDSIVHTGQDQICVTGKGYIGEDYGNHDLVKLEAYLTEEPNSIFAGYTLQYITITPVSYIKSDAVTASSHLVESSVADYLPENILDDDLSSAWVEGAGGYGIGESIEFRWEEEQTLLGIAITNGYCKSEDAYYNNGRMTEFYIEFSDGTGKTLYIEDAVMSMGDVAEFYFTDEEVRTDSVRITILNVVQGYKYEDTCISEIRFLQ